METYARGPIVLTVASGDDPSRLTSSQVARELGVDRSTLHRWQAAGYIEPAEYTAGGHARWDIEQVRRQIRERREQRKS